MSAHCSAGAVATAAAAAVLCLASEFLECSTRGVAQPSSATMSNATPFCGTLEPTRVRWKGDQVHTTSLRARETNVQECNGVKSVYSSTKRERDVEKRCSHIQNIDAMKVSDSCLPLEFALWLVGLFLHLIGLHRQARRSEEDHGSEVCTANTLVSAERTHDLPLKMKGEHMANKVFLSGCAGVAGAML